jgi:hypothetical protein
MTIAVKREKFRKALYALGGTRQFTRTEMALKEADLKILERTKCKDTVQTISFSTVNFDKRISKYDNLHFLV